MLDKILENNTVTVRSVMKNSSDLILKYAKVCGIGICVISCDGQTDANKLANLVYRPLSELDLPDCTPEKLASMISGELLIACDEKPVTSPEEIVSAAMSGFCVILIDGTDTGYAVGVQGFETRSVTQPENHRNIRGAREGFVEALHINMSLVRRRVKSPDLVFTNMTVGKTSGTEITVCRMESIAERGLADEVIRRLERCRCRWFWKAVSFSLFSKTGIRCSPKSARQNARTFSFPNCTRAG